jgi:hypothetical protein
MLASAYDGRCCVGGSGFPCPQVHFPWLVVSAVCPDTACSPSGIVAIADRLLYRVFSGWTIIWAGAVAADTAGLGFVLAPEMEPQSFPSVFDGDASVSSFSVFGSQWETIDGSRGGKASMSCDSATLCSDIVSEPVVEYERLGGRDARRDETDDVRLFVAGTSGAALSDRMLSERVMVSGRALSERTLSGRTLTSDSGRRIEKVLDLLKACLSAFVSLASFASSSADFLTAGSLNSNFPFLSEAKYSSPRPKTTWRVAKSRVEPSVG